MASPAIVNINSWIDTSESSQGKPSSRVLTLVFLTGRGIVEDSDELPNVIVGNLYMESI